MEDKILNSVACPEGNYNVSLPNGKHMINGDRYEVVDNRLFRSPFQGNDLYALKDEICTLKLKAAETLDASDEAIKELDGDLQQALDNLDYFTDKIEEIALENQKSDFEEHNVWHHGGGGVL